MARPIDTPRSSRPEEDLRDGPRHRGQRSDLVYIESLVRTALDAAHATHERLGAAGTAIREKNRFGDRALVCDVEAEKAVIEKLAESNLHIRLHSEEHGILELGSGEPVLTAMLDGLDGSGVYARAPGEGRYGTMLAIFDGEDPAYSDYLVGAIHEHANKRIYLARKGGGAEATSPDRTEKLSVASARELDGSTRIYYDRFFEPNRELAEALSPLRVTCLEASSIHYADLAAGAVDLVLECTRKGNLEIAVAYALIREAGGVMLTEDREDLGRAKFSTYGQPPRPGAADEHRPIVSACTRELAEAALERLSIARSTKAGGSSQR